MTILSYSLLFFVAVTHGCGEDAIAEQLAGRVQHACADDTASLAQFPHDAGRMFDAQYTMPSVDRSGRNLSASAFLG